MAKTRRNFLQSVAALAFAHVLEPRFLICDASEFLGWSPPKVIQLWHGGGGGGGS